MEKDIDLFERFLMEAPDDDPPDMVDDNSPPDMPDNTDDSPPDMGGDDIDVGGGDDSPPDMGGDDDTFSDQDEGFTDEDNGEDKPEDAPKGLDVKVSSIMNASLYNHFLRLLTSISSQISTIKDNSDMLYVLSPESVKITKPLKELETNVKTYLKDMFSHENYSKNLLFFNKSINLLKLLNDSFNDSIQKSIKDAK